MQVGVYQAKTHFPELLVKVENGEEITITRHGKAVARILPIEPVKKTALIDVIAELKSLNEGRYAGSPVSELIAEGRR